MEQYVYCVPDASSTGPYIVSLMLSVQSSMFIVSLMLAVLATVYCVPDASSTGHYVMYIYHVPDVGSMQLVLIVPVMLPVRSNTFIVSLTF